MSKKPSAGRPTRAKVEADFYSAIDRIMAGKPAKQKLRQDKIMGRLKLTFSTVAFEAGRSRSLIAHENCGYQAVRMRILKLSSQKKEIERPERIDKALELRRENDELKAKLADCLGRSTRAFPRTPKSGARGRKVERGV